MTAPQGPPGSPPEFGPSGEDPPDDLTQPLSRQELPAPYGQPTSPMPQQWAARQAAFTGWDVPEEVVAGQGKVRTLLIAFAIGSLVSVAVGVYSGLHSPTGQAFNLAGFTSGLHAKAWLASLAVLLAIVQLVSALAMWGRLPGIQAGGAVSAVLHRWCGRLAVIVSLPVAAHCLYALGFQGFNARVVIHSLLGCFFYGTFVGKMILLGREHRPGWAIPVVGGLVFTGLTGLWLTSSLWFFTQFGVHF